jgi:hypothetical protein
MGKDDGYDDDWYHASDGYEDDYAYYDEHGYDGYEATTVDTPGLLGLTTTVVVVFMFILMPCLVVLRNYQRARNKERARHLATPIQQSSEYGRYNPPPHSDGVSVEKDEVVMEFKKSPLEKVVTACRNVVRVDRETKRIMRYTAPFTLYEFMSGILDNVCLALVSHFAGAKEGSAYAVMGIFLSLTDEFLGGPAGACTTLCSHAVGASNNRLAGQYAQMSILFFLVSAVPFVILWYAYTYEFILYLDWGDEETAEHAQSFVNIYIWSFVLDGISGTFSQLLDVTNHEIFSTIVGIARGAANVLVLVIAILVNGRFDLNFVGVVCVATSLSSLVFMWGFASFSGWFKPFEEGMYHSLSLRVSFIIGFRVEKMGRLMNDTKCNYFFCRINKDWRSCSRRLSHLPLGLYLKVLSGPC